MPRSSQPEQASLLIAAISGRALAASARKAGFVPLVADFFADADTASIAHACRKLDGKIGHGFGAEGLEQALDALARSAPSPILGCVYGAGFEDRPELLARIAQRWTLLGNDAATVERVKAPESFFGTLDRLGIAHPRTAMELPGDGGAWLRKRQGGSGGGHIVASRLAAERPARAATNFKTYFQERITGLPVSALFVADGTRASVLGFSEQWTAPRRGRPFRYGGAVRPAEPSQALQLQIIATTERAAAAFGLKGLGSADFMVSAPNSGEEEALLIEINPRPGATLDIFDRDDSPLLRLHIEAVSERRLPGVSMPHACAAASAIVFASEAIVVPETIEWPEWAADQPKRGERIDKNRPICTVLARAETKASAKRLVEERIAIILAACGPKKAGRGDA